MGGDEAGGEGDEGEEGLHSGLGVDDRGCDEEELVGEGVWTTQRLVLENRETEAGYCVLLTLFLEVCPVPESFALSGRYSVRGLSHAKSFHPLRDAGWGESGEVITSLRVRD